jgi:uncharacterized membrane protein YraQ (UPF0718 family)
MGGEIYFLPSSLTTGIIMTEHHLQSFKTLFISILLEAIPFILLGVLLSVSIQSLVSGQMIRR